MKNGDEANPTMMNKKKKKKASFFKLYPSSV